MNNEKETEEMLDYQVRRKAIKDLLNGNSQQKPASSSLNKVADHSSHPKNVTFPTKLESKNALVDEEGLYDYYQQYKQRIDKVENICRKFEHN